MTGLRPRRALSRFPENPEWNEDGLRMELVR